MFTSLLIIQILFIFKISGQYTQESIIVTSLVHNLYLPKDTLINPFFDPEIDALRNHNQQLVSNTPTGRSIDVSNNDTTDLTERTSIDSAWQNLVVSGPTAVSLLAQVMVLSSKLDFSFRENNPNQVFRYVQYPDSFRMTLAQISNEAWRAFLNAHINMDKLQMNMQRIPAHVKITLRVLNEVQESNQLQTQILKILNTIGRISNECISLSNTTHLAFSQIMNHLGEVIILTENSRNLQETRLRETEIELNVSRVWQMELEQLHTIIKEHLQSTEEDLTFAHVQYQRALAKRRSGLHRSLMRITGAFIRLYKNAANAFKRLTSNNREPNSASTALDSLASGHLAVTTENGKALLMAEALSNSMKDLMNMFHEIFYSTNGPTSNHNSQEMENILYEMETYIKLIDEADTVINITKSIVQRAKDLGSRTVQLVKNYEMGRQVNRNDTDDVLFQFNELLNDTKTIDAAAKLLDDSSSSELENSHDMPSDNVKMLIEITQRQLENARKRNEESLKELRKNMAEMNELVGKIARLDLTRMSYTELLDYMRQALRLLGTMRQIWAHLVLFFSKLASQAEISLSGTLKPFIEQTKFAVTDEITMEERSFFIDLLKDQSVRIHDTSYSLFLMSRTYVDMSNAFFMPRLTALSLMFTAKDDNERMTINNQIASETWTIQEKVNILVEERKQIYTTMMENQRTKLHDYLQTLGGPSVENQKIITEADQLLDV